MHTCTNSGVANPPSHQLHASTCNRMPGNTTLFVWAVDSTRCHLANCQGSDHFKNEQRKAAATDVRIHRMKQAAARLTAEQLAGFERCLMFVLFLNLDVKEFAGLVGTGRHRD